MATFGTDWFSPFSLSQSVSGSLSLRISLDFSSLSTSLAQSGQDHRLVAHQAVCSDGGDLPQDTEFLLLEEGVGAVRQVKTRICVS